MIVCQGRNQKNERNSAQPLSSVFQDTKCLKDVVNRLCEIILIDFKVKQDD